MLFWKSVVCTKLYIYVLTICIRRDAEVAICIM